MRKMAQFISRYESQSVTTDGNRLIDISVSGILSQISTPYHLIKYGLTRKLIVFSSSLSSSFQRYRKPGRDVTVDECIEGFTGRASNTVNIPTKPTPIGFKIWVLADNGYVLDLLWHVRGDGKHQGPQGFRTIWKELGFSRHKLSYWNL